MKKRILLIGSVLLLITVFAVTLSASIISKSTLIVPVVDMAFEDYVQRVHEQSLVISDTKLLDVATTITFNDKLSFSEMQDYIACFDIQPVMLEVRGLTPDGERITIGTRIDLGFEETEKILTDLANEGGYSIAGFISMEALVDASEIRKIQSDNRTFIVDTSNDMYFQQNRTEISGDARNALEDDRQVGFPKSLAWELEDLADAGITVDRLN